MGTLPEEFVPRAAQEDARTPVAVARILRRERTQRLDQRRIPGWHAGLVAQARVGKPEQHAGVPLLQAALAGKRYMLAASLRARHFRR
jgi:hypothetical protein